jgi:hypothetical protein
MFDQVYDADNQTQQSTNLQSTQYGNYGGQ